jgi:hypothetical protein
MFRIVALNLKVPVLFKVAVKNSSAWMKDQEKRAAISESATN